MTTTAHGTGARRPSGPAVAAPRPRRGGETGHGGPVASGGPGAEGVEPRIARSTLTTLPTGVRGVRRRGRWGGDSMGDMSGA